MTAPQDTPDELDTVLEDLYFAGAEADSIEVIGGGNNQKIATNRAKSALRRWRDAEVVKGRIDELRNAESLGDPVLQEKYFDERIAELEASLTTQEGEDDAESNHPQV